MRFLREGIVAASENVINYALRSVYVHNGEIECKHRFSNNDGSASSVLIRFFLVYSEWLFDDSLHTMTHSLW